MKTIAIISLALVGGVFAGLVLEEPSEPIPSLAPSATLTAPRATECYVGSRIFNGTDLIVDEEETECPEQMTTCQTKLEVSPGTYRIYKQCQTPDACANIQNANPQQCYSDEANDKQEKVCHFCCEGNLCNDGSEIDVELPGGE